MLNLAKKKAIDRIKTLSTEPASEILNTQNPSQNQLQSLIDLYSQEHFQQGIDEASRLLLQFPLSVTLYNIRGASYAGLGELDSAIDSYRRAIKIKPDFTLAINNLGVALKGKGNLKESIQVFKKALDIQPDYAEAYNNLGLSYKEEGRLKEAIEALMKALSLKPDYVQAYNNMGITLQQQGRLPEAIEVFMKALSLSPNFAEASSNIGTILQEVKFSKPVKGLPEIIIHLLDRKIYVKPFAISSAVVSLVRLDLEFHAILEAYLSNRLEQTLEEIIFRLSKVPLLLKMMQLCPLPDVEIESFLTWLRSEILNNLSELSYSKENVSVLSALALQCFTNEYIYSHPAEDTWSLNELECDVHNSLKNGNQPSALSVACLASYKALYNYSWHDLLYLTDDLTELVTRQIAEPQQENLLRTEMPVLTEIIDGVSLNVREQYEEYPYPRWINLQIPMLAKPIHRMAHEINLKIIHKKIFESVEPKILIAGCGTGQHSIQTASRFKDCNVLAIDLSLSSLAYAKRKTQELGITNIEYMQADILDLAKLGRQFDIVESFGVLHHMNDPMAGWRVLTSCLKPGGLMMISLYSELARQHIVKMRREIKKEKIISDDQGMKYFRNKVMKSNSMHHKKILSSPDFFSLGPLRDLIFHVQEHRFTMKQIKKCLSSLGLEFCGFEADQIVNKFKKTNFGLGDPYDLEKWHIFEKENPDTFSKTDGFWCQKVR